MQNMHGFIHVSLGLMSKAVVARTEFEIHENAVRGNTAMDHIHFRFMQIIQRWAYINQQLFQGWFREQFWWLSVCAMLKIVHYSSANTPIEFEKVRSKFSPAIPERYYQFISYVPQETFFLLQSPEPSAIIRFHSLKAAETTC